MSRELPHRGGVERPVNTVVLLREAYIALNDRMIRRLAERGHEVVRPAHGAVFQYIDDTGTPVARLAERAQMTKQAMAELVAHLERHHYVVRTPDPGDRRAKLVTLTDKGREVFAIAAELVPEVEEAIDHVLGAQQAADLRSHLARLTKIGPPSR